MNTALLWDNLVAYSLQIGLLIGVAALVPALLRMALPKARLAYWYVLLAACLGLPLARPWQQAMVTVTTPALVAAPPVTVAVPMPSARVHWTPAEIGLLVLALGALGRVTWLAVGLWKLRRYRRHSAPWRGEAMAIGPRPEYRISDDIGSPVTFGFWQPVVLLPGNFDELPVAMQHAVLCHEALHVERRDWAFTVVEELVRALFWFHPAIWWLLGEVQLAREQAVDREVVERTQARDEYVDALLTVAGARLEMDLAPAPLFLRRRHLKQRVIAVVQEIRMSKTRIVSTWMAGLAMLLAACWFVTAAFPLAAEPQVVADGAGVTVETNGARLMHRPSMRYPAEALVRGVQGTVVAQARLAADGTVVDASILSGPDALRKSVLQQVLSWHFAKELGGSTQSVTVNFQLPAKGVAAATEPAHPDTLAVLTEGRRTAVVSAPAVQPLASTVHVRDIQVQGLSDQVRDELLAVLPLHVGDNASPGDLLRFQAAVGDFDEHLLVRSMRTQQSGPAEMSFTISAPDAPVISAITQGHVTVSMVNGMPKRVTIGGNVIAASLIFGPKPAYPPLAKQARVSGVVNLHAFISAEGLVESLQVVPPAHPLLAPAAVEAVRQWRYKPTMMNGEPVAVETTIQVSFQLADDQQ